MRHKSIRLQLLAGLLVPLAIVALVQFWFAYRTAQETAQGVTDRLLLASAHSMAEQLSFSEGGIEAIVPPSALSMFDLGYGDNVFYRVSTSDGRLLAGYPALAPPAGARASDEPQWYDATYNGRPLRLVVVTQPIPTPKRMLHGTVVVGETLRGQREMRTLLWVQTTRQQAFLVVVALAVAWIALRRGLSPLLRFSDEVQARRPNEFRPFSGGALQAELRPLVVAINEYMLRLQQQVEAQRRFTANAAHQLRTPLTLLRTQASYAQRGTGDERLDAIRAILSTTNQLVRITNQLLALARSEASGDAGRRERIDLAAATREILEEYGPLAIDRGVDLAFEVTAEAACAIDADPAGLRDLIVNLIDNALRFTSPGGTVVVTVSRNGRYCTLLVEDTGPGIPAEERLLVFERFYRVREGVTEGSGLGLAIVKEIAEGHGATVALRERVPGPGVVVDVRFVAASPLTPDFR